MSFRFDFDSVNKILLIRVEGRVTDELLARSYREAQKYATEMCGPGVVPGRTGFFPGPPT